jgi:NifU-like protein involved in Fe-S cluster formation
MAETDLIKLYSGRILALASDIPHATRLDNPQASVKKRSPLCGSSVTVDLCVKDGKVSEFGQDVRACALGQASAAILGHLVIGRTLDQLVSARNALKSMLTENGPVPPSPFDGYGVLVPAREFRNRHASIMLAIEATVAAMEQVISGDCA